MVLPIVHFSLTDCFSWHQVALSIRSTNVWVTVSFFLLWLWPICKFSYEERSLGIFEPPPDAEDEEPDDITKLPSRRERVGRYLGWHLRRQMSIGTSFAPSWCKVRVVLLTVRSNTGLDIWWLVWAVFIIAIIERKNLLDESKRWFDLFRIIFELVSAFGGIGLSLGFPSVCIMAFDSSYKRVMWFPRTIIHSWEWCHRCRSWWWLSSCAWYMYLGERIVETSC